jgi:hypothetical protein
MLSPSTASFASFTCVTAPLANSEVSTAPVAILLAVISPEPILAEVI